MKRLEKMKEQYESIPIPEELNARVQEEIARSRQNHKDARENIKGAGEAKKKDSVSLDRRVFRRIVGIAGTTAAAACIIFTAALNTSPAFAKEAAEAPLIRGIAKVLTIRSYDRVQNHIAIHTDIPSVEAIAGETGIKTNKINKDIYRLCEDYGKTLAVRAEEYRQAFLETGGSEEEWADHDIKVKVGYEIKSQNDRYLSFVVRGFDNWSNAYSESRYYNLDVQTGEDVSLEVLMGEDFREKADPCIEKEIEKRQEKGEIFFSADEGGFRGIGDEQSFYINERDNLVVVFARGEIAPESSGEIEFEISLQGKD